MREKLNENPMMQIAVIGVLILVVGFIFLTRMKGSDTPAPPATTAADPATAGITTPGATAMAAVAAATSTDPAAVPTDGSVPVAAAPLTGAVSEFTPGRGLPKSVVKAYDSGAAVALLVTKNKGFDDKAMRRSIDSIKGKKDVDLFMVPVQKVPNYSQITQGVDLDRVPALIVIKPKHLDGKAQPPNATITYGYRTPQSVAQAVEDQLYHGKILGYSPK